MTAVGENTVTDAGGHLPLEGYRVLELGNFIAAPFATRLFADFGAEVIKVERPGSGDELRHWRLLRGETSLLFHTHARNKKSVTLDLRTEQGRELALELARRSDVVIENFRPGTLERWGLSYEALQEVNRDVILVRISGYGQTGPYRDRPGFGGVAEAVGGLRNLTGHPDMPPTRVGVSLGDSVAGMFGMIGALMALLHREHSRPRSDVGGAHPGQGSNESNRESSGQVIDVALYEAVFALMESLVPEYEGYGVIRQRTGNMLPGVAPSNTYPCLGDKWAVIGANADAIFKRLMYAIDRPDLAEDPALQSNQGRAQRQEFLDQVIAEWTGCRSIDEVMAVMVKAAIPAGPIYDAEDIAKDPHFRARSMLEKCEVEVEPGRPERISFPGVVPKLSRTPGRLRSLGPELGQHNDEIYGGLLGMEPEGMEQARRGGVI